MINKIIYKRCICACLLLMLQACNTTTPEKYISITALNGNLVSAAYRPMFLKELIERKNKNQLAGITSEKYVRDRAVRPVEESIKKVKQLKETKETKELIAASLDVMTYGKHIFENDYILIARLIDDEKPVEEIDKVIEEMYEKTELGMAQRFDRLHTLALTYAQKNKIPFDLM